MLKLADNSHKLHKSSTVVLSILLAVLSILEIINQYLPLIVSVVSPTLYPWLTFGFAIAIGVGRYIQQRCLKNNEEDSTDGISQ